MALDKLLVLENVIKNIKFTANEDNAYTFEGTFTVFDIKNENGRFYRKDKFLPHVQRLQPTIEKNKLLGELDHPNDFTVKYSRSSHIIEKLEYDPAGNRIVGRIRLLDTERGKDAKAIADAGVPLNVSSRASGKVLENGDVEIGCLYTYDLVADPGFKEAELRAVNESISDDECSKIMKLVESYNSYHEAETDKFHLEFIAEHSDNDRKIYALKEINKESEKSQPNMNNDIQEKQSTGGDEYVKASAMKKWSDNVVESIESTQSKLKEIEKIVNESKTVDLKSVMEKLSAIEESINVFKEDVENKFAINDKYFNYLKEGVQTVSNYSSIYLREQIENIGNYAEGYLKEELNKTKNYVEGYLREQIENIGTYTEDYLRPKVENIYEYNDTYLTSKFNLQSKRIARIEESIDPLNEASNDTVVNKLRADIAELNAKINTQKAKISKANPDQKKTLGAQLDSMEAKMSKLKQKWIETRMRESSEEETDTKLVKESNLNEWKNSIQSNIQTILESAKKNEAVNESKKAKSAVKESHSKVEEETNPLYDFMPSGIKSKYDALSESKKKEIELLSENYALTTPYQVEYFWSSVSLDESVVKQEPKKVIVETKRTGDLSEYGINTTELVQLLKKR